MRLQSGEDIICGIEKDEYEVTLIDPFQIIFKRTEAGTVMVLLPWIPLELVEKNISKISHSDILTYFDPKKTVIEYYQKMIDKMNIKKYLDSDENLDNLKDAFDDYGDDDFPEDQENISLEEIRETLEKLKKGKLH